jgi:hypothetical protein
MRGTIKKRLYAFELVILVTASIFLVVSVDALPLRSVYFTKNVIDTHPYVFFDLLPCQTITGYTIDRASWENSSAFANSPWFTIYYPPHSTPVNPNPVSYNYTEHKAYFSFTANTAATYFARVAMSPHSTNRFVDCCYSVTVFGIDPLPMTVAVTGVAAILTIVNIYFNVPIVNKKARKPLL